jgi:50S ribosomal subunit-associated GTPase HflX
MVEFNLKKLHELEGKERYRVQVSNKFAALDAELEINGAWETIRENLKISAKESLGYLELKKHKPWFDESYLELLDQRKQAKLRWLQDACEVDGYNLNNVRRERYFRNKKKGLSESRIN